MIFGMTGVLALASTTGGTAQQLLAASKGPGSPFLYVLLGVAIIFMIVYVIRRNRK